MSRCWCRVKPADEQVLVPLRCACPECGRAMRIRYSNHRAIVSLRGLVRLRLKIRRCESRSCGRYHQAWRPEAEAALALPQHEFGLDVIALVGALRYREHRSVPEIHQELSRRGVAICAVLCSSRHQHQLVRRHLYEDHILLFSWGYESWRNRMLSLP
jgi:hypothetical protein